MTLSSAMDLIRHPQLAGAAPQVWADLGCGEGLFSRALLKLLYPGSITHAIDKQPQDFREANITFHELDFEKKQLPIPLVNGIIMANALHYVRDQLPFVQSLKQYLLPGGQFIVVEYETAQPNPWIPYPLNSSAASEIFRAAGFNLIKRLHQINSVYQRSGIYSVVAFA